MLKIACDGKYCADTELILREQDWNALSTNYVELQFRNFFQAVSEYNLRDKSRVIAVNDHLAIEFKIQNSEKFVAIFFDKKLLILSEYEFGRFFYLSTIINQHFSCLHALNFESFYRNCLSTIAGIIGFANRHRAAKSRSDLTNEILSCANIIKFCPTTEFNSTTYTQNYLCLLEIVKFYPDQFVYDVQSTISPAHVETYV